MWNVLLTTYTTAEILTSLKVLTWQSSQFLFTYFLSVRVSSKIWISENWILDLSMVLVYANWVTCVYHILLLRRAQQKPLGCILDVIHTRRVSRCNIWRNVQPQNTWCPSQEGLTFWHHWHLYNTSHRLCGLLYWKWSRKIPWSDLDNNLKRKKNGLNVTATLYWTLNLLRSSFYWI